MINRLLGAAAIVAPVLLNNSVLAGELSYSGYIAGEVRVFTQSPARDNQDDSTLSPSLALEPEFLYETDDGNNRVVVTPFLRLDAHDDNRTHGDLREAKWEHFGDGYDLIVGADKVFWGVAESNHLVDIINQTDLVENPNGEEKLGQPMVQLAFNQEWGTVTGFIMPYFRERTFADHDARLSAGLPISDDATYDANAKEFNPDLALRWSHAIGDFDIGAAYFHGTSRDPRFILDDSSGAAELVPHYDLIDQVSLDLQYTMEAWLWKLEAMGRGGHGTFFGATVAGFEYTIFQIFEKPYDLGLLAEYHYDGRDTDGSAPLTPFDDDIFLGARFTLNDAQDTSLLAGGIFDRNTGTTLASVEAERRFGDSWKVEVEAQFFVNVDAGDPLYAVRRDDVITLRVARYF